MITQADRLRDIRNTVSDAYEKIDDYHAIIAEQQEKCPHDNAVKTYGGATGHYDPSCDKHWCDFECPDCQKRWRLDSEDPGYRAECAKYDDRPRKASVCAQGIVDAG